MKRRLCILLLLFTGGPFSFSAEIHVKAQIIEQSQPIWTGQRVRIAIDALATDGWVGISKVLLGDIDGALVLDRNPGGVSLTATVNGQVCSGQRKEISIFPQRSGEILIPEFTILVEPRAPGSSAAAEELKKHIPSLSFTTKRPAGAAHGMLVSTPSLKATQQWSTESADASVGDAVERTIHFEADDLPGMIFQPLEMNDMPGVGIYRKQPSVQDRMQRGQLRGMREDSVTIVFEAAGTYAIPDITVQWFNLKTRELKTEMLPGRTFTVLATATPPSENSSRRFFFATAGAIVLTLLLIGTLRPMIRQQLHRLCAGEWMAFQRVRRAARQGSDKALLNEVLKWGDLLEDRFRLDLFLKQYGPPDANQALNLFYQAVWANRKSQSRMLLKVMVPARNTYLKKLKALERERKLLPPLNP
jgi:hypothetical protein